MALTLQMRESVQRRFAGRVCHGTPDVCAHAGTGVGYEFLPFGIVHDNPLYAVGNISSESGAAAVRQLPEHPMDAESGAIRFQPGPATQEQLRDAGWRAAHQAQKQEEENSPGRPVMAVFLCDVSGSMRGQRLAGLKAALRDGSGFISPDYRSVCRFQ